MLAQQTGLYAEEASAIATEAPTVASAADGRPLNLGYADFLRRVLEKHGDTAYQRLEWGVAATKVRNADADFEPNLGLSSSYTSNERRLPTGEERSLFGVQTPDLREVRTDTINANIALSKKIVTGTKLELLTSLNRLTDPSQYITWQGREYRSFSGLVITQPLLKGFGTDANLAGVRVAEADRLMAYHNYRKKISDTLRDAANGYWELYLAQQRLDLRRDSLRIADRTVADYRERVRLGKSSPIDLADSEVAQADRKSSLLEAEQDWASATQRVRSFLMLSSAGAEDRVTAADQLSIGKVDADVKASIANALHLRPDYQAQLTLVSKENLRIAYAKNQTYPQLDLKLTYGFNGLDNSPTNSFNHLFTQRMPQWSAGFEVNIPLSGGIRPKSELDAANLRKRQALELLKTAEVEVVNSIQGAWPRLVS
ncbi:MAG: TolC family protein, partial [Gallionella sp.]